MKRTPTPWTALTLSALAAALFLAPRAGDWLAYDREAVAAGQWWRLLTGHVTHWSLDHLAWDLAVFAVLGIFWERRAGTRALLACVGGAALLISAAVWLVHPEMTSYRGLSGVDCALVTAIAADAWRRAVRDGRRGLARAVAAVVAGTLAKVVYELATGSAVFVDAAGASFVAVPLAHLVGGVWGWVVSPLTRWVVGRIVIPETDPWLMRRSRCPSTIDSSSNWTISFASGSSRTEARRFG